MNDTWWVAEGQMDDDQQRVVVLPLEEGQLVVGPPGSGKDEFTGASGKVYDVSKETKLSDSSFHEST